MNKLVLAEIPYLNCAPFYWNKDISVPGYDIEWKWAHPRELGELALRGLIDAGPVSLLNIPRLDSQFELLPFGIAAKDEARSVVLFSKRPLQELHEERIGLTPQSATSTQLLRAILTEVYRISPIFETDFSEKDAARLLIGNQALFALLDPVTLKEYPFRLDMGRSWKEWKGSSFVFARWMMRRDLPGQVKENLERWVSKNLELFDQTPQQAIAAFQKSAGWKMEGAEDYLDCFNYRPAESDFQNSLAIRTDKFGNAPGDAVGGAALESAVD
ncbi:MAG: hypothetical protein A2901_03655 [Elusimicrobia bacterium RIFCSPLOWO2_01_FULL_54_10]|nr:MAG: hypothetical protein A2901_03655 [Elusimicrobia bacterium RIFCSPLOWO2_01_FULL_54_10]